MTEFLDPDYFPRTHSWLFMSDCDRRKFAKYVITPDDLE